MSISHGRRSDDGGRGSEVSRGSLFEDQLLQCQVRHSLAEPAVLFLQLLETPDLIAFKSAEPYDCGCKVGGREEVSSELVVARGNASPVLEPARHALDEVAPLVCGMVEWMEVLSGGVIGNDLDGSAVDEELPQCVRIIGRVGRTVPRWRRGAEQGQRRADVTALTWCYFERDGPPETVADGVDLCGPATAGTADGLGFRPLFRQPPHGAPWRWWNRWHESRHPATGNEVLRTDCARPCAATSGSSDCRRSCRGRTPPGNRISGGPISAHE